MTERPLAPSPETLRGLWLRTLAERLMGEGYCSRCGGRHVPTWVEMMKCIAAEQMPCTCCTECRWRLELFLKTGESTDAPVE